MARLSSHDMAQLEAIAEEFLCLNMGLMPEVAELSCSEAEFLCVDTGFAELLHIWDACYTELHTISEIETRKEVLATDTEQHLLQRKDKQSKFPEEAVRDHHQLSAVSDLQRDDEKYSEPLAFQKATLTSEFVSYASSGMLGLERVAHAFQSSQSEGKEKGVLHSWRGDERMVLSASKAVEEAPHYAALQDTDVNIESQPPNALNQFAKAFQALELIEPAVKKPVFQSESTKQDQRVVLDVIVHALLTEQPDETLVKALKSIMVFNVPTELSIEQSVTHMSFQKLKKKGSVFSKEDVSCTMKHTFKRFYGV